MFSTSKKSAYSYSIVVGFWALSFAAYGNKMQPEPDSVAYKKELKEINVHGQQTKHLTAALPSQQISSNDIELLTAQNVADVAKHFAGVTVKDYGGIGGLKTVSVRGLGAAHTGVMFDGLMVSDIQSGQIDLSQFCVDNIASVSLNNGQPLNLLQSARAFASSSLLSFETRIPNYDSTKNFMGRAGIKAGSFGLIAPNVLLEKYILPKWFVSLNSVANLAKGDYPYIFNINPYGLNLVNGIRKKSDVNTFINEFNSVYRFSDTEKIQFKANYYFSNRGLPGSITYYNTNDEIARLKDKNLLVQSVYENKTESDFHYVFTAKYNKQNMLYTEVSNNYATLPYKKRIENYTQNEYYLSGAAQFRATQQLTIALATDGWYNNLFTTSNLNYKEDPLPTRFTGLTNLSMKYVCEKLTIGGNLLYTYTHETADSTFAAPDRKKLSPTVYLSWRVSKKGNLVLRTFYKNIFRLPTFTELYYHDMGYKYLLPENTHQWNAGITFQTQKIKHIDFFSVTADAYYNRITDKITIVYGMPFSSVRNIGLVGVKGLDLQCKLSKQIRSSFELELHANYSYQLAQDKDETSETYNDIIPYTPIHSGSGTLSAKIRKWEFGYTILFAGKRYSGQNADIFNYLSPYTDQGIFSRYQYMKFSIMAEVKNLADVNYAIVQYYPMPGRQFQFSVNYQF